MHALLLTPVVATVISGNTKKSVHTDFHDCISPKQYLLLLFCLSQLINFIQLKTYMYWRNCFSCTAQLSRSRGQRGSTVSGKPMPGWSRNCSSLSLAQKQTLGTKTGRCLYKYSTFPSSKLYFLQIHAREEKPVILKGNRTWIFLSWSAKQNVGGELLQQEMSQREKCKKSSSIKLIEWF